VARGGLCGHGRQGIVSGIGVERRASAWWTGVLTSGTFVLASANAIAAPCQLIQVGELPVALLGNTPLIPASIDGHAVQMLVDTGAGKSLIWRSAAHELNLDIQSANGKFYGAGGSDAAGVVWVHDFGLAGASVHNLKLYAAGRGTLPGSSAGLLGEDVLSKWDIEFDLSSGKIRLFLPKNCNGDQVVYWASAYFMLNLLPVPGNSDWLEATVRLNGREVIAMFDTGASFSTITPQALRQAGVQAEAPPVSTGEGHGLAAKPFETSTAVFPTLSIGQETIQNVKLSIADLFGKDTEVVTGSLISQDAMRGPGMLIGADFFLAHRIYVARSQGRIYFTYKGGPIFQHFAPKRIAPPVEAAPSGDTDGGDPKQ
jgi:predicted aspartyl protease